MKVDGHILHTIRAVEQQAYHKVRVYGCVVPHLLSRSNGVSPIFRTDTKLHAMLWLTLGNGTGIE